MINHAVAFIPVDKVALDSITKIEPSKSHLGVHGYHSMTPHPTRRTDDDFDMVGRRFGTFTVVGCSALPRIKKGRVWSCRCDCGAYEVRRTAVITGPTGKLQTCADCYDLMYLRDQANRVVRIKFGVNDINQMEKRSDR